MESNYCTYCYIVHSSVATSHKTFVASLRSCPDRLSNYHSIFVALELECYYSKSALLLSQGGTRELRPTIRPRNSPWLIKFVKLKKIWNFMLDKLYNR